MIGPEGPVLRSRAHEWAVLATLTVIQFAAVLDYVIMMPLGPVFLRVFQIEAAAFGWLVSAYSLAAGISALASATWVDRFDRKRLLLAMFVGFIAGTAACGLATSYGALLCARVITGMFGGVMGGIVMAMVADLIPPERRGTAIGTVTSAFPLASILGIPVGLTLATLGGWNLPFLVLAGLSLAVLPLVARVIPSLPAKDGLEMLPGWRPHLHRLGGLTGRPLYLKGLFLTCLMVSSGGLVIPFLSTYLVRNVGLAETELFWVYLVGGGVTFVTMNLVGRLVDRVGRFAVLIWAVAGSLVITVVITGLPQVGLPLAVLATTLYMVGNSSRWVPVSTLVNGVPDPADRGGFLAVNTSVQSLANALAAGVGGWLVGTTATGELARFSWNGTVSVALILLCLAAARPLERAWKSRAVAEGPASR